MWNPRLLMEFDAFACDSNSDTHVNADDPGDARVISEVQDKYSLAIFVKRRQKE